MKNRGVDRAVDKLLFILLTALFFFPLYSVLCSLPVTALHNNTTLQLAPNVFYETKEPLFNFTVTASFNKDSIIQISLDTLEFTGLKISNDTNFNDGWNTRINNSVILWENNSLPGGSFVVNTYLQFLASAPKVSADKNILWQILTLDNKGHSSTRIINITLKNDATPPEILYSSPGTAGQNQQNTEQNYFRSGIKNLTASVKDPETGVKAVWLGYHNLSFNNSCNTANSVNLTFTKISEDNLIGINNYTSQIDLSLFKEKETVCFTYYAESNGGEISVLPGNLTIDNTPPIIKLIGPADNGFVTGNLSLSFNISENVSSSVSCGITIDGVLNRTINISTLFNNTHIVSNNSVSTKENISVAEGIHSWSIKCSDPAGNFVETPSRIISVDNSPPHIEFISPDNISTRGGDVEITANISDFSGINSVYAEVVFNGTALNIGGTGSNGIYTFVFPTLSNTTLGNYTFVVHAEDTVGYSTASTHNITLTYKYNISLAVSSSSPLEGANITVSGSVKRDDNTSINETQINLSISSLDNLGLNNFVLSDVLNSTSVLIDIANSTGDFAYSFIAPPAGNYNLTAEITPSNGLTFSRTLGLSVQEENSGNNNGNNGGTNSGSSGGSNSGSGKSKGSSSSSASSSGSQGASGTSGVSSSASSGSVSSIGGSSPGGDSGGAGSSEGSASSGADSSSSSPSGAVGVGKATGFLGGNLLKYSKLAWTFLLVMAVIGGLIYISKGFGISAAAGAGSAGNSAGAGSSLTKFNLNTNRKTPPVNYEKLNYNNFRKYDNMGLNDYLDKRLGQNENSGRGNSNSNMENTSQEQENRNRVW